MAAEHIKRDFPSLEPTSYQDPRSPEDFNYNCFAFVLRDVKNWWEPPRLFGHYWPPGFPEDVTVETAAAIVRLHGFTLDSDIRAAPKTESIAIYAIGNEWTHLARFTDGVWLSKLGDGHDIQHSRLDSLEGEKYGKVVRVLSRETEVR